MAMLEAEPRRNAEARRVIQYSKLITIAFTLIDSALAVNGLAAGNYDDAAMHGEYAAFTALVAGGIIAADKLFFQPRQASRLQD